MVTPMTTKPLLLRTAAMNGHGHIAMRTHHNLTAAAAAEKRAVAAARNQNDSLFSAYDEANMKKIRSAFRIPAVVVGLSEDHNFATANVAAYLAEVQVFVPERKIHDEFMNHRFVNNPAGLGLKTVKLESSGPSITNPEQIVKTLTAVNVMGGVTPRNAIDIVNELEEII
mgnify:CR=1 FL=1